MTSTEITCDKHASTTSCGIDRISDLPDAVLEHILSFLRTKRAVQTSVISKRWRNLWARSSCIDFSGYDFNSFEKLKQFGNMVLSCREASYLHTLFISCSTRHYEDCCRLYGTWICSAMKFQPIVCSIYLCTGDWSSLSCIFTCASIEDLCVAKLDSWSSAHIIPNTVNLPHLRKLCLKNTFLSEKDANTLFTGCPVLDDLKLEDCTCQFSSIFRQKLIRLALIDCRTKDDKLIFSDALPEIINLSCVKRLQIRNAFMSEKGVARLLSGCPLLEDLLVENCCGSFLTLFRQQPRSLSLQDCKMTMHSDKVWWEINTFPVKQVPCEDNTKLSILIACSFHPIKLKLIWKPQSVTEQAWNSNIDHRTFLHGAESFMLCFPDAKFDLKKEMRRIGKFNNLKRLSLKLADWCMHPHEIDPVIWFLQNSPNIEELTLYNPKRERKFIRKGNKKQIVLRHESSYYNNLSIELSDHFKNLKQVEIKFCKNLFGVHSFKETVLQQMELLVDTKVILSEYSGEPEHS